MMGNVPKLRVAICGGGIGGLIHACALSKFSSISTNIYESASQLSMFGAGIGMWPRTWGILEAMGLADDMKKVSLHFPAYDETLAFTFRKSDQIKGVEFLKMRGRGNLSTFHRGHFQQTMLDHLSPNCGLYYSKRLHSYSRNADGSLQLYFQDGSAAACDVLVGADGLKSATRSCMLLEHASVARSEGRPSAHIEECIDPEYSGWTAYRSLIPVDALEQTFGGITLPRHPVVYTGRNAFILAYPVSFGQMVNLVVFSLKEELKGLELSRSLERNITSFDNWESEAKAWLKLIYNPTKWAIHTVKPLSSYVFRNVALLGDAAHGCTPHQGTGAGQAIEPSFLVIQAQPRDTIPRVLSIYDSIRRPWTQELAERARINGQCLALHLDDLDFENSPSNIVAHNLHKLGGVLVDNWKWAWETDARKMLHRAIERLEGKGVS
ncbi:hypothetical protein VNI00_000128 [Paramarasmius palmivorus]|uniref:FAD-binding domain-containing protein n=1 Tax=Paramarasmius palmivorus TaxID=297713 RepID=A0AAW0EF22_9AGAR